MPCTVCSMHHKATHMHTEAEKTASKYTAGADNYIVELEFIFGDFIFFIFSPCFPRLFK